MKQMEENLNRMWFYHEAISQADTEEGLKGLKEAIKFNYNLPIKERRKYLVNIEKKCRSMQR